MKRCWIGFCMCQSMFCAIPFPCRAWDEKARSLMLLFLPIIGLEIGLLWVGLSWLCDFLNLPSILTGLVLCAVPYLLTGFIHLDGFMDVTDAIGSCRDMQKRREILKDPHVGSFAVIGCAFLLLAGYSFCATLDGNHAALLFIPVVSRCCSALAITLLQPMPTSQYAGKPKASAGHITWLTGFLLCAIAGSFWLGGRSGLCLFAGMAAFILALWKGVRSLGGMNGDISGYALTLSELAAVAVSSLL